MTKRALYQMIHTTYIVLLEHTETHLHIHTYSSRCKKCPLLSSAKKIC